MTYQIFQLPKQTLIGSAAIKPSWKVSFFLTGTTTPTPVYTTSALSVAHAQPVQADSGGVLATVYLDPSIVYKASVYDQNDVLQYTVDPVNDSVFSQASIGALLYPRTAAEISAGVTPSSYVYDYDDLRRYGLPMDGSSTCTTALNKAIAVATAGAFTDRHVFKLPRGTFVFDTQPDDIVGSMILEGAGRNNTVLVRNYTAASASIGLLNFRQGGGGVAPSGSQVNTMVIGTGDSKTGGCLISLVAPSSGEGPDYCSFDSLRLTNSQGLGYTGNGPDYPFYIDGSARSSPQGVRNTWVTNSIIFGGASGSAYLKTANGTHFIGTDTASSGSVSGKIVVTGATSLLSNDCAFIGGVIYGMDLDYAKYIRVDTQEMNGSVTNTSNTDSVYMVLGRHSSGTVQTNWTNSSYQTYAGFLNQGQVFNGDVQIGATANIGAAPRVYALGGAAGPVFYGEQGAASGYVYNSKALSNGGTYYHVSFDDAGTSHGSISSNGTNTAYNTSSDARLKFDIQDALPAGALIDAIRIRQFSWKINSSHQRYGVVAQEIEQVFPECVTVGIDDDATLAVDYSKLVPLLVAEVQALRKRVAEIESA